MIPVRRNVQRILIYIQMKLGYENDLLSLTRNTRIQLKLKTHRMYPDNYILCTMKGLILLQKI